MKNKKKIIFAMILAGGGHYAPAKAAAKAMESLYPDTYEITILDFMAELGCKKIDEDHKKKWDFMIGHLILGSLLYYIQYLSGKLARKIVYNYISPCEHYFRDFLLKEKPYAVVSTHYFNSMILGKLKEELNLPFVLITQATEFFKLHPLWIIEESDYYIAYTKEVKQYLIKNGIRNDTIHVCNYPSTVASGTKNMAKTDNLKIKYRVPPSKITVLISFGGSGLGNPIPFIEAVERRKMPIHFIVATGKNEELYYTLKEEVKDRLNHASITPVEYAEELTNLFHIADICFIKSGTATTMEALLMKKPILFYRPAAPNEFPNISTLTRQGVGMYVGKSPGRFVKALKKTIDNIENDCYKKAYARLTYKNGSTQIAKLIHSLIS